MHEMSVAIEICRMAEHHVGRDNLPSLISVGLDVGDDAGLEEGILALKVPKLREGHPDVALRIYKERD